MSYNKKYVSWTLLLSDLVNCLFWSAAACKPVFLLLVGDGRCVIIGLPSSLFITLCSIGSVYLLVLNTSYCSISTFCHWCGKAWHKSILKKTGKKSPWVGVTKIISTMFCLEMNQTPIFDIWHWGEILLLGGVFLTSVFLWYSSPKHLSLVSLVNQCVLAWSQKKAAKFTGLLFVLCQ